MTWIDWLIVFAQLLVVAWIGWRTQRHMKGVSDFLAGGRVAGRYLVAVAQGTAGLGLISVVAVFEMYYKSGFAIGFWGNIATPVSLMIALTGFVIYRYRETRAMTLAQFFEVRYSRSFRIFAGLLAWISGVINYALFPAVGARFIVYYGQLPPTIELLGFEVRTFAVVMAIFLTIALIIVMLGGQVTTMVTDCVAGLFSYAMYAIVVIAILYMFSWTQMKESLLNRPPGQSMLNPFDTGKLTDFNIFYIAIGIISGVYSVLAWQGCSAYNAAAASPHEQKMGSILGAWRGGMSSMMIILLTVAAFTYLNHPDFAPQAAEVRAEVVSQINLDNAVTTDTIRQQMLVPMAVRHFLPVGVTGAFFAVMIFLMVSTDTTYLHSWGSIFVQDVVMPLRGRPLTPRQQIWLLRLSILFVAVFSFFFSLYFSQVTYILMFFALTGSIWLGGAGSVILGGLYWKRGTAAGAWTGLLVGSTLGVAGFLVTQFWADPIYPFLSQHHPGFLDGFTRALHWLGERLVFVYWEVKPDKFPITGQEIYFITMISSILGYVTVSLVTCRQPYNLDRMLHRGEYRRKEDRSAQQTGRPRTAKDALLGLLGIDANFTRGDKILSIGVFSYSMSLFALFLVYAVWHLRVKPIDNDGWANYFWFLNVGLPLVVGIVTSVWFTWGGLRDLRRLFHRLTVMERNILDDGRVVGHTNAEDLGFIPEVSEDQKPPDLPEKSS